MPTMLIRCLPAWLWLALALSFPAFAQQDPEERIDEEATRLIREYTTDPMFLTPLVDHLPASDVVPSPLKVLGYLPGAPGRQTYYADILRYYDALAEASPRVAIFELGKSDQGQTMVIVAVADEELIRDIDQYREYTRRLADPRKTGGEEKEILAQAKPFYLLTGGLHSPETGSPEMLMELAYRLAVGETPMVRRIRAGVITLIIPVLETDGWNRQLDWYYRHTKKHDDWENAPRMYSPFWGDYVLHDNNRDGIMLSQRVSRNTKDAFFRFFPQVTHDLHESIPLLYVSGGTGPYYPSVDPITRFEWQWMAFNETTQLTSFGVPGVWAWGFYDGWYPGYLLWIGNNHNAIGRFYETFGNAGANTYERTISPAAGKGVTSEQWYRPLPPPQKVKWSLRNNTNLMQSGCLLALDFTARNNQTILKNFWTKGMKAIEAGRTEKPHAWVIPSEQKDRYAASLLLDTLKEHRIELHRLTKDFQSGEKTWPAGSVVVRLDQPYRNLAKALLEVQKFPEDTGTEVYDATAWTLGLMLGVTTERVDDPEILKADMAPLEGRAFTGEPDGGDGGDRILIEPAGTARIGAVLALKDRGGEVALESFQAGGRIWPAGTLMAPVAAREAVREAAARYGLTAVVSQSGSFSREEDGAARAPRSRALVFPRLGLFCSWFNTQDPGWARFALDREGVPYTLLTEEAVRQGGLNSRFDVIIVPHHGDRATGQNFLRGVESRFGPLAYNQTPEFQHMGVPMAAEDITGGLGFAGLRELEKFVEEGGVLITLGSGSHLVTDFGLVTGVATDRPAGLGCPGTLVSGWVRAPANPIVWGYSKYPALYRGNLPVFTVARHMRRHVVAQFGTKLPEDEEKPEGQEEKAPPLLLSGLLKGSQHLDGTVAILDAPKGKGRVILFGFNPLYRWMSHASFGLVYNAILDAAAK
jgi:hypothetical protein